MNVYAIQVKLDDGIVFDSRLIEGLYSISHKRDLAFIPQKKVWVFEGVAATEGEAFALAHEKRDTFLRAIEKALYADHQ
jgi:hypothetical protein